ncbi:hypothetical protein ASC77_03470 [Nocardioides sp. Root1257]|uniref:hypothetical protein n=1 Tax=unclassified Nocardioides TaxID=2615069 RepID=UPI0006F94C0D|nr:MULTISPECIES: hypothetical protein [unclassified Nocardioides]KQW53355.1 hypothetical protein ASC77_03470 [Nocardioides sp. Root1257]KRC56041.1 hypothetical protein ASE24_03470 [Nocardioides sp. Root224]
MTSFNRWCVAALLTLLVIAVPAALHALPARDSDIGASDLLERVRTAEDHPWSGYVQTQGALALPVAEDFADVGALFSDDLRMRAWWRGSDDWRVDRLLVSGETDLVHQHGVTIEWSYERDRATISRDPDIRLPRAADVVPPVLTERLLRDVSSDDVRRIPARRVAGISAPGLRVEPSAPQSSIDHVDLWADPGSGVPLRVDVYAEDADSPSFVTELRDFSASRPAPSTTTFDGADGIDVEHDDVLDIADAANQYAPLRPPSTVGGLDMSSASDGAVGVYGVGITQLIAIPLRGREARPLREQLRQTPDVATSADDTLVTAGPVGVLLTGAADDGGWLITGTVTAETLRQAAIDLARGTTYVGEVG